MIQPLATWASHLIAGIAPALRWGLLGVLGLLVIGAIAGVALPLFKPGKDYRE